MENIPQPSQEQQPSEKGSEALEGMIERTGLEKSQFALDSFAQPDQKLDPVRSRNFGRSLLKSLRQKRYLSTGGMMHTKEH